MSGPPRPRPSVASLTGYAWEESSETIAAQLCIDVSEVVRFDLNTVPWQLPIVSPDDELRARRLRRSRIASHLSAS